WPIKRITLTLDDKQVFAADGPDLSRPLHLFEGFAAPGRHTLTIRLECGAVGGDRVAFGTESTFVVDLPDGRQTRVAFDVDESGSGPQALLKKKQGTFDVRVKADVKTLERDAR